MRREIVKPSVKKLEAYKPEPQEAEALLNANENPYNLPEEVIEEITERIGKLNFNRYPDPASTKLIKAFSNYVEYPEDQILAGNGLDEILSIISNTFIGENDTVVSHSPGFAMYKIWTEIAGGNFLEVPDKPGHKIDIDGLAQKARQSNAKIIYICSPNNPTGYTINRNELEELLEVSPSLVILDEAYIDFDDDGFTDMLDSYDNLVILRTLSKAFRSPAIRCGFAMGPKEIIDDMKKVKSPYNMNALTQIAAETILENVDKILPAVEEIKNSREEMLGFLKNFKDITVFPSDANFIYITTPEHKKLQEAFLSRGVQTRYYPKDESFRITIGTPEENKLVKETIQEVFK